MAIALGAEPMPAVTENMYTNVPESETAKMPTPVLSSPTAYRTFAVLPPPPQPHKTPSRSPITLSLEKCRKQRARIMDLYGIGKRVSLTSPRD